MTEHLMMSGTTSPGRPETQRREVSVAAGGQEDLNFLGRRSGHAGRPEGQFSLVLLDLHMPRVNRHEQLYTMHGGKALRGVPVVVTPLKLPQDRWASEARGAADSVIQPEEFGEFDAAVSRPGRQGLGVGPSASPEGPSPRSTCLGRDPPRIPLTSLPIPLIPEVFMEALERELRRRLLLGPFRHGATETRYVGRLPPGFHLPLPAGSRVLGSTQWSRIPRSGGLPGRHTRVLLDAELPLLSCLGQWRDLLRLTGWEEDRLPGFPAGGFLPALLPEHLHCSSREQHLSLRVTAREVDGVTWVTLDASPTLPEQRAVRLACCQERWGPPVRLRVPSGTTVEPLGGGGSGGRWHHAAVLGAERTAAALFDHFSPQLAEQGWTEVSRTTDSPMSVGSWFRVRGGPGALLLFLELVEAKYDATLKVIRS